MVKYRDQIDSKWLRYKDLIDGLIESLTNPRGWPSGIGLGLRSVLLSRFNPSSNPSN